MTFQVQGRTFLVPNHNTFNLNGFCIPKGFSLYDGKSRQYLCPDQHGNVEVKKDGKYLIRRIFNAKLNDKLTMAKISLSLFDRDVKKEKTTNEDMILKTSNANKKCNDKNKDDDNDGNKGSNPFLKFCHEYKENNKGRKVLVKELKEKWNELDNTMKKEKYGWNDNDEIVNNNKNKSNDSSSQKRKKDDDTIIGENDSTKKQKAEKDREIKNNKKEEQRQLQKIKQELSTKKNKTKKKDKDDNDDFGSLFDSSSDSD